MKFLCVSCNAQMKLTNQDQAIQPDRGSLTIRYECPECLMEIAMLTNPFETQLVTSMGVEIGGQTVAPEQKSAEEATAATAQCPFSKKAREALTGQAEVNPEEIAWTAQALVRLQNVPSFVRDFAKKGINRFAKENGYAKVDEKCLDQAKEHFNM